MASEPTGGDSTRSEFSAPAALSVRRAGFRLLRRLLAYHVLLALALVLSITLFPSLPGYLPIGGVAHLATTADVSLGPVGDARFGAVAPASAPAVARAASGAADLDRLGYARRLVIALVGIWLLMLPIAWVRRGIHRNSSYDHSLDGTTLVLPGVVAGVVLVVQHSLALAFALAGIVAGVQFRRALQDTFDALFILVAIGTGVAAGVGALEVAVVMTIFFCYATVYVCCFGDGLESDFAAERKESKRLRKVKLPED